MVRSLLVVLFPPVLLSQEGKVGVGVSAPDVFTALHLFILLILYICSISGWYAFQIFGSMEKHYIQQVCA